MTSLDLLVAAALRQPVAPKPAEGAPCNGCGACCILEVCEIGVALGLDGSGACRGLRFTGERYVCGPIAEPEPFGLCADHAEALALLLGVGAGCCSSDEGLEALRREPGDRARGTLCNMTTPDLDDGIRFRLPRELAAELRALAAREGRTLSAQLRFLVREAVERGGGGR